MQGTGHTLRSDILYYHATAESDCDMAPGERLEELQVPDYSQRLAHDPFKCIILKD